MRFPVVIEVRRSLLFAVSLALLHSVSVFAVLGLPWSWPLRMVVSAGIVLSAYHCLFRSNRVVRLILANKTDLQCQLADGTGHTARILPDTTVFNQLVVLRVYLGEQRKVTHLVVFPDQMSADQFRSLRIWLRWRAPTAGASSLS